MNILKINKIMNLILIVVIIYSLFTFIKRKLAKIICCENQHFFVDF